MVSQQKHLFRLSLLAFAALFAVTFLYSQEKTESLSQTLRGEVIDQKTQQPIPGASIVVTATKLGAKSKSDGTFEIKRVPIGRQTIKVSSLGYEPFLQTLIITSGKQAVVKVELMEKFVQSETITVTGNHSDFASINEAALASATVFTVDDVERYAGSRGDVARMAQSLAGVVSADDNRNDIIIRGGSPTELLWRLDGLDIPNPNHFATQGATGGPVSMLNSNLLANSDFMTGAFPAEYSDRMSGAFDLRTRNGNKEKYEFIGQFGFNGFEGLAEGPLFSSMNGSFIVNYRKSFLDIMEKMGIDFGVAGTPKYQDASVKLDFSPSSDDKVSLTGLWGTSSIFIENSKLDTVYTGDWNITNGTDLFALGVNWQHLYSERSYGTLTLGTVYSKYSTDLDSITTDADGQNLLSLTPWLIYRSTEGYSTIKYRQFYSTNSRNYFSAGVEARFRYFNIDDKRTTPNYDSKHGEIYSNKSDATAKQYIGFVNWNWRITEDITTNLGVNAQYLDLNKTSAVEPRASFAWKFLPTQTFTLGFGIHSQSQPLIVYFGKPPGVTGTPNMSLDFTKATHYVAGYSAQLGDDMLFKIEGYYKEYKNAPVKSDTASDAGGYSFLNAGTSYGSVDNFIALKSGGKGKTYGSELSLIKHFSQGYYLTATGSFVRQEYTGADGIWRFGAFDNKYIINLLTGYEYKVSPTFVIDFSGKFTTAGGAPYTPVDLVASSKVSRTVLDDAHPFSKRSDTYSRADIRIDFRQNFQHYAIISYISVENILNRKNTLGEIYHAEKNTAEKIYQLGIFPIGGVKVEF